MNVYVIADRRLDELLTDEGKEEYSAQIKRFGTKWDTIPGVLPYGHNLTGPFIDIHSKDPKQINYYRNNIRQKHEVSYVRNCFWAIQKADSIFAFFGKCVRPTAYMELAYAYSLKKDIRVCLHMNAVHNQFVEEITPSIFYAQIDENPSFRDAYEAIVHRVSADMSEEFVPIISKFPGICPACGCSYRKGEFIQWSRIQGAWHAYCVELQKDPEERKVAMFNAALVQSMRDKCAELENENLMLMAKCSSYENDSQGESV